MKTIALVVSLVALVACRDSTPPKSADVGGDQLVDLSASLDAVRSEFNAHKQESRFLTLLSPTCPACVHGARAVRKTMVDDSATNWIRSIVVWIPMLDGEERTSAVESSKQFADLPVPQFWDGDLKLGAEVARSLDAGKWIAWDIYLLYSPGAEWGTEGLPKAEAVLVQAGGVVIGTPGTLPPAPDQSRLPKGLQGRAVVVGEQENLEALLGQVARDYVARHPRS